MLGELYQRYMELVYGVCLKYLKEPELAQDAVMQIFEELVSKLKKHEVDNFQGLAAPGCKKLLPDATQNTKELKNSSTSAITYAK